jgi:hypothetical protein
MKFIHKVSLSLARSLAPLYMLISVCITKLLNASNRLIEMRLCGKDRESERDAKREGETADMSSSSLRKGRIDAFDCRWMSFWSCLYHYWIINLYLIFFWLKKLNFQTIQGFPSLSAYLPLL